MIHCFKQTRFVAWALLGLTILGSSACASSGESATGVSVVDQKVERQKSRVGNKVDNRVDDETDTVVDGAVDKFLDRVF